MTQRAGWWQRYWQASRGAQVGLAFAAVVALCGVCSCTSVAGLAALGSVLPAFPTPAANAQSVRLATATPVLNVTDSSASTAATITTPTALASPSSATPIQSPAAAPTAIPTATPMPTIPQSTAILGGSVFAFDKKFGANNCCYLNGWNYQGQYGPMWTGLYTGDPSFDESSRQRAVGIDNDGGGSSTLWTMSQAKAICGGYLPPDAKYHGTTTVYLANFVVGIELHYSSASLANTLPPQDFTDVNGKHTTSGTFYVYYQYGSTSTSVYQCALGTNEQFAQNPF